MIRKCTNQTLWTIHLIIKDEESYGFIIIHAIFIPDFKPINNPKLVASTLDWVQQ